MLADTSVWWLSVEKVGTLLRNYFLQKKKKKKRKEREKEKKREKQKKKPFLRLPADGYPNDGYL